MEEDDDDEKPTLCEKIPKRYVVTALLMLVAAHVIGVRSILLIQLNFLQHWETSYRTTSGKTIVCEYVHKTNITTDLSSNDFNFSGWRKGETMRIFICYYLIYIFFQPVAGYISDRFVRAPRFFIFGTILSTTVYAFLAQLIIISSQKNSWPLKVAHFVLGLGQSAVFPSTATILSHWIPYRQRAFVCGLCFSGLFLGQAIEHSSVGPCIYNTGMWYLPTYIGGILGLILLYGWYKYGYADPKHSPVITKLEQSSLILEMGDIIRTNKPVPIGKLLCSFNVWIMIMGSIFTEYFWYTTMTAIPTYHRTAYLLSNREMASWTAVPYTIGIFGPGIFGFLSDWLVNNEYTDTITLRKFLTNIGTMGPPIYILAETYAGCDVYLARSFLTIALCFQGCSYVGIKLLPLDIAPNYSGLLYGLTGLCNATAFLADEMFAILVPDRTLHQFRLLFTVSFLVALYSNIWVVLMGHVKTTTLSLQSNKFYKNN